MMADHTIVGVFVPYAHKLFEVGKSQGKLTTEFMTEVSGLDTGERGAVLITYVDGEKEWLHNVPVVILWSKPEEPIPEIVTPEPRKKRKYTKRKKNVKRTNVSKSRRVEVEGGGCGANPPGSSEDRGRQEAALGGPEGNGEGA